MRALAGFGLLFRARAGLGLQNETGLQLFVTLKIICFHVFEI